MRNKRFPNFPDDADYNTNAPSYYEDLARKEKLIRLLAERIWGYEKIVDETLEQIQERFRAWDKNLEDFSDDVKELLQVWMDNGTFDHIINDTIFKTKADQVDLENVTAQLQQKANKEDLSLIKDLTPKKPFDTLEDLQNAFPNGDEYIHLVTEDGNWYYWNDTDWVSGGIYQATKDENIDLLKDEISLTYDKYVIKNGVRNSDFSDGTNHYIKPSSATFEIVDSQLKITKSTTSPNLNLALGTDLPYIQGHKYYVAAKITPLSTTANLSLRLYPSVSLTPPITLWNQVSPVIGQEYTISNYLDGLGTNTGNASDMMYLIFTGEYDAGTADSYSVRNIMVFDLTAIYGAGNEPTKSEFVSKLNNDFDGFIVRLANDYLNKSSKIQVIESKIESIEQGGRVSRFSNKKIACFGDSITMKNGSELAYTDILEGRLGATVYNVGFGGCRMSSHSGGYDAFSMYRLADTIVSGDWTLQDANVSIVSAYAPRLNMLKSIDFNTLDYLTISYGTNDYASDKGLDSVESPMSSYNYLTSARYALDKILTAYPNIKIILLTPIWRARYGTAGDGLNGDIKQNGNNLYLYEFADGLMDLAKEFKVNVIDMYYDLGINKYTSETYLSDGLHANDAGKTSMGNKIASYFESNF